MTTRAAEFTEWESKRRIALRAATVAYVLYPEYDSGPTRIKIISGDYLRVSEGYTEVLKALGMVVTLGE